MSSPSCLRYLELNRLSMMLARGPGRSNILVHIVQTVYSGHTRVLVPQLIGCLGRRLPG